MTRSRHILSACLLLLASTAASLAFVEFGLQYYAGYVESRQQMDPGFLVYHAERGWEMARNWSGSHRHYDFDVRYSTNAQGLRGSWPDPRPGVRRHALIGDSFTFGLGANDDETFAHLMSGANRETVYLNGGIAGYSTDQQYLYLREYLNRWRLDRMSLVVYLANDLLDNPLKYPLQAEMGKPLFAIESGELKLMNIPVPLQPKSAMERSRTLATMVLGEAMAGRQELSWRNRWQLARTLGLTEVASPEDLAEMPGRLAYPLDLFIRLAQEIRRLCEDSQVSLSLVLMPGRSYVEAPNGLSAAFQEHLRREILARQAALGAPVIDLASRLRERYEADRERLFHPNEGHLSARGHQVVAELLQDALGREQ